MFPSPQNFGPAQAVEISAIKHAMERCGEIHDKAKQMSPRELHQEGRALARDRHSRESIDGAAEYAHHSVRELQDKLSRMMGGGSMTEAAAYVERLDKVTKEKLVDILYDDIADGALAQRIRQCLANPALHHEAHKHLARGLIAARDNPEKLVAIAETISKDSTTLAEDRRELNTIAAHVVNAVAALRETYFFIASQPVFEALTSTSRDTALYSAAAAIRFQGNPLGFEVCVISAIEGMREALREKTREEKKKEEVAKIDRELRSVEDRLSLVRSVRTMLAMQLQNATNDSERFSLLAQLAHSTSDLAALEGQKDSCRSQEQLALSA